MVPKPKMRFAKSLINDDYRENRTLVSGVRGKIPKASSSCKSVLIKVVRFSMCKKAILYLRIFFLQACYAVFCRTKAR